MKNTIKIAFSGAHSTGKSSFIHKLSTLLNDKNINYKIINDLAVNCPLPILRDHTVESTLWIASKGILEEIEAENKFDVVLVDRPITDCWAYFNATCKGKYKNTNTKLKTLLSMIENWLPTYDIIHQTIINENIPIENDKGRDLDVNYRSLIQKELVDIYNYFDHSPQLLKYDNREKELTNIYSLILNHIEN